MSKFKVGDKVRRIRSIPGSDIAVGEVCTIASVTIYDIVYLEGRGAARYLEKTFELVQEKPQPQSKGHPHAELMAQYAEDAKETDKPWERWEIKALGLSTYTFSDLVDHPQWHPSEVYRRKPQTININGYEVPEPVRSMPKDGTYLYYVASPQGEDLVLGFEVGKYSPWFTQNHVDRGWFHTTREAAELHAKALLSFTNGKG